ncbi:MAG: beta-galactosidase trimerization domain-containing protein, partial [Acidobacteriaceae bacterium]
SIPYSWRWPLSDVSELLRIALDIRRLNKEIAALASVRPEVAILYSTTSIIQIAPQLMRATSTPYLDELRRVYEGSLYLDADTTFISENQILKGMAPQYKVILIPTAKHLPSEVVNQLLEYVKGGGHLVVSPESFMTDQYLRPLDFLNQIGIRIRKNSASPDYNVGALEQQYDQTLRQSMVSSHTVKSEITTLPGGEFGEASFKLSGEGILQTLEIGDRNTELARFPDGRPAIVRHTLGGGRIYYLAIPLDPQSYSRLLDRLFEHAGISRPVRFTDSADRRIWKVECRSLRQDSDWLLYLINHGERPEMVKVALPVKPQSLKDLRRGGSMAPYDLISLAPGETRLIRAD